MDDVSQLVGQRVGRFRVTESTRDCLVLRGRLGRGLLYLLAAGLIFLWAAAAWRSVFHGHPGNLKAAVGVSAFALVLLVLAAARIGSRFSIDRPTAAATHQLLFGLHRRSIARPGLSFVSITLRQATPKAREQVFLQLMNDQQRVVMYVLSVHTDRRSAPTLFAVAERMAELLQLRPRVEGAPATAPAAFVEAYQRWSSICPDGVQAVRRRVA